MQTKAKKFTKAELAEMLATAMNILNDIHNDKNEDREDVLNARNLDEFYGLAQAMPEHVDFMNNGTVFGRDLL